MFHFALPHATSTRILISCGCITLAARVSQENWWRKPLEWILSLFLSILPKNARLRIVELVDKRVDTSAQSWTRRAEGRHPPKVDYCSELRNWVQRAILEAEKNEDFNKKNQLLSLLRFLKSTKNGFWNKNNRENERKSLERKCVNRWISGFFFQ